LGGVGAVAPTLAVRVEALVDRASLSAVPTAIAARPTRAARGWSRKLRAALPVGDADLVHGLDVDIPWWGGAARVATVHDLAQIDTPWAFGRGGAVKRRLTQLACRNADALVAVSAFTAERIEAHFARSATVVHEAPRSGFVPAGADAIDAVRRRYALPDACVVYVGNLEPRKDVPRLAAACRLAGVPLVVSGGAIQRVALPGDVRTIGYVPDADLPALYGAATVVAYVSRYEGFGLPPVEALAAGATVVATRTGALDEVAPQGIEYVPIGDVERLAATLGELFADPARRAERAATGLREVAALSWVRAARETAAVWSAVLGRIT
jgi:glycosyltransferase involved in cell wall biosynthesis